MKKILLLAIVALTSLSSVSARELGTHEMDSVSAALGTIWGDYLRKRTLSAADAAENEAYLQGVKDALEAAAKGDAYFSGLETGVIINNRLDQVGEVGGFKVDRLGVLRSMMYGAQGRRTGFSTESAEVYLNGLMQRLAEDDRIQQQSAEMLSRAAARQGAITTPTGMVFEVITEGEGESPKADEAVAVTYVGRLSDGSEFGRKDSPVGFTLEELIPGFRDGLKMMKPGGRYRITIPATEAYGESGIPAVIPPNSALEYEVELVKVIPIPKMPVQSESSLTNN